MTRRLVVVLVLGAGLQEGVGLAQDDPEGLQWDTSGIYLEDDDPFHWGFTEERFILFAEAEGRGIEPQGIDEGGGGGAFPRCGALTRGSGNSFPEAGMFSLNRRDFGQEGICPFQYELAFGDRGFIMEEQPSQFFDASVTRQIYVPEAGGDFVRWTDRVVNDDDEEQEIAFGYSGWLGWFGGRRGQLERRRRGRRGRLWIVVDADDDGEGEPALAVVWGSPDSEVRPNSVRFEAFDGAFVQVEFDEVPLPADGQIATMLFAIQANTRADAAALAEDVSRLGGEAQDELDDDVDNLYNFVPSAPGAPRVRFNGPYLLVEGGATRDRRDSPRTSRATR